MSAPRLQVDLSKIHHNARTLVHRLGRRGIQVMGITKAALGSSALANTLVAAGVSGLGDSRIDNIEAMRHACRDATSVQTAVPIALTRSPMLSQVGRVVASSDFSFNTELRVISSLSLAARAAGVNHGVVLMVELGDLREGILPEQLSSVVRETLRLPNITLEGIGTNLACRSGVTPDDRNMGELSALADRMERTFGIEFRVISGGNSANLPWARSTTDVGRINHLRLGEAILLGREPLSRQPIEGLSVDAVTLVAEVIETKDKPSRPRGVIGEGAFGTVAASPDIGMIVQSVLALGHQDTDPAGLTPNADTRIIGASSDHLIVSTQANRPKLGDEMHFRPNYAALLRAMTSPFVSKVMTYGAAAAAEPAVR